MCSGTCVISEIKELGIGKSCCEATQLVWKSEAGEGSADVNRWLPELNHQLLISFAKVFCVNSDRIFAVNDICKGPDLHDYFLPPEEGSSSFFLVVVI